MKRGWQAVVRVGHEHRYEYRRCPHLHRKYERAEDCGYRLRRQMGPRPARVEVVQVEQV